MGWRRRGRSDEKAKRVFFPVQVRQSEKKRKSPKFDQRASIPPAMAPNAPTSPANPMLRSGNSTARPAALLAPELEPELEPDALVDVDEGVKPMGPVWVVDAVAALDAEDAADDAAAGSESSFKKTWSTTCRTPFQRTISGVTIFAVTFPLVTNAPDALNVEENVSPAELVALVVPPPSRLPE